MSHSTVASWEFGKIKMSSLHTGVTFYEDDRDKGPFKIRIGGTNEFVTCIDPDYPLCHPAGKVDLCVGWDNPESMVFLTMDEALSAADQVWKIEGFHTSIEATDRGLMGD
jgi:hypothetical protein